MLQRAFRFGTVPGEYSMEDLSLLMRLNAWRKGVEVFLGHPLLGIGVGNLRISDYFILRLGKPEEGIGYVDNQYLQMFAEAGIVAGIAFVWYVLHVFRIGITSFRKSIGTSLNIPAIGYFGCLMICLIGSGFWVITVEHELFALMILYIVLLLNIGGLCDTRRFAQMKAQA